MADLQETFSGTEAVPAHLTLDEQRLSEYFRLNIPELGRIKGIEKFKGGQSNPTYAIDTEWGLVVLRRRPPGTLVASAHAIDREYRIVETLHKAGFPVPRPYRYCSDPDIIGSEFYIVEHLRGRIFWDPTLPGVEPAERAAIYDDANKWLTRIHTADYEALGLGDFGRGEGYSARNLERWSRQYKASQLVTIPDMDWLIEALPERVPASPPPVRLLHGDYGLHNLIIDQQDARVIGILDWEMATLGDPFVDFAHHLRPWWTQPVNGVEVPTLIGKPLKLLGIPTETDYTSTYLKRIDLTEMPDEQFYLAFAQFRYAAMVQGILKRYANGTAANRRSTHTQAAVSFSAASARRILEAK
jgi:aminoglycoside phosphotransferase (APT) family kinase protein